MTRIEWQEEYGTIFSDVLTLQPGWWMINLSGGTDTLVVNRSFDEVTLTGGNGRFSVEHAEGRALAANVEFLQLRDVMFRIIGGYVTLRSTLTAVGRRRARRPGGRRGQRQPDRWRRRRHLPVWPGGAGKDRITDFQTGLDIIRISDGPARIGRLDFEVLGDDVQISRGRIAVLVENVSLAAIQDTANFELL